MYYYDVTGLRCKTIQPTTTLYTWCREHNPKACCNASLYDMKTRVPIGTIIENGKLVHNDGNGYGVGIKDGALEFGKPWDKSWDDYLTGYNAPVLDGKYVAPSFADTYVFNCKLSRIGVGRKNGRTCIVTDDNVTLQTFAQHAINNGFDTLVNLDGGASRFVWYDRKLRYNSSRVPYNALVWLDESDEAIEWAAKSGIITKNDPNSYVTKFELATALYRLSRK